MEDKLIEILEEICEDESIKNNMDIDLFEEGLLDSLSFAELLYEIEEKFGVIISPSELTREGFNSPNLILNEIKKRLQE